MGNHLLKYFMSFGFVNCTKNACNDIVFVLLYLPFLRILSNFVTCRDFSSLYESYPHQFVCKEIG